MSQGITQNRDAAQSFLLKLILLLLPPCMHQLGPVYKDPGAFKLEPHTQDNLAYGHVQQSAKLQGPVYEDIKPDPRTQGNISYGHVQFS